MIPTAVAVGVAHHGVAGAPERVVRLLLDGHALGDQRGDERVDLVAGVHLETEDDPGPAGPAPVPLGREGGAVEIHVDGRGVTVHGRDVVRRPDGVAVGSEVEPQAAVEGAAGVDVADDEVHLVEADR